MEFKTMKIYSEGLEGDSAKSCISENFLVYSICLNNRHTREPLRHRLIPSVYETASEQP